MPPICAQLLNTESTSTEFAGLGGVPGHCVSLNLTGAVTAPPPCCRHRPPSEMLELREGADPGKNQLEVSSSRRSGWSSTGPASTALESIISDNLESGSPDRHCAVHPEAALQKSYKRGCQVKNTSPCRNARNIFRHPAPLPYCRLFFFSCLAVLACRGAAL